MDPEGVMGPLGPSLIPGPTGVRSVQWAFFNPWLTSHPRHAIIVWRRRVAQQGTRSLSAGDSESSVLVHWRAATAMDRQRPEDVQYPKIPLYSSGKGDTSKGRTAAGGGVCEEGSVLYGLL